MTTLKIINGNSTRLRTILAGLAPDLKVQAGDTVLVCKTEQETAVGRAVFERLLTEGYTAIKVDPVTKKTEGRISEFDPEAGLVVIWGLVAGG